MTADPLAAADDPASSLIIRRKRLRFRAWHRGTRESDLLLGTFADRNIDSLDSRELDAFENLLEMSDPDIYDWMTGREPPPPEHDTPLMTRLKAFRFTHRTS